MQFIVLKEQLLSVIWAALLGTFFAACYDCVRVVRMLLCTSDVDSGSYVKLPFASILKHKAKESIEILTANILDVIFAVFASVSFCIFLYWANNGRFRWYLLFGCFAGFCLYRSTVGRLTAPVTKALTRAIRTVAGLVLFVLSRPIVLVYVLAAKAAAPIAGIIRQRKNIRKTEKIKKALHEAVILNGRSV